MSIKSHVVYLYSKNGVRSLWRGTYPSLIRTVPGVSLYMSFITFYRNTFVNVEKTTSGSFLLGVISRSSATVVLMPFSVLKTQIESHVHAKFSIYQSVCRIFTVSGLPGFYRGLFSTVLRDAPYSGIFVMTYNRSKEVFKANEDSCGFLRLVMCALVASCFASTITQPADVIKTHRQLFTEKRENTSDILQRIYKTEGIGGYFRGSSLRISRKMITSSIIWINYDFFVKILTT
uniref:Slc25a-13 n=1 Tax=Schmidtea mediterranea TaxID=79327 RepID=A0A0H3YJ68_SCHMD|nr:slc25a-13 [Schmidtea mediterranea]